MPQNDAPKEVVLTLPSLYPKQKEIFDAFEKNPRVRFVVAAAGTKAGKTHAASIRIVKQAWENYGSINWWIAPVYKQSEMAYRLVKRILPKACFTEHKTELRLTLNRPDGTEHSIIEFKSGEIEANLRGFAVHFLVMDEIARIPYESYISCMTTLTQTGGKALLISTPKGHDFFFDLFKRGDKSRLLPDEEDIWPEYISFNLPTSENPYVTAQALDDLKKSLPEELYKQEILAQFLDKTGTVFKNFRDCVSGEFQEPRRGIRYVIGVDLARTTDYTVIIVMDTYARHVVYFERFTGVDWSEQYRRIQAVSKAYNNAVCIVDATNQGDPVCQAMAQLGIPVYPFKISTNQIKRALIERLRNYIEDKVISFPMIPVLIRELEEYQVIQEDTGTIRYSAPKRKHDDAVLGLAICCLGLEVGERKYAYKSVSGV